jgi:hypothetical protein
LISKGEINMTVDLKPVHELAKEGAIGQNIDRDCTKIAGRLRDNEGFVGRGFEIVPTDDDRPKQVIISDAAIKTAVPT